MTRFERELRQIIDPAYEETRYVGRACIVRVGDGVRAKIQFETNGTAGHYDRLRIAIIDAKRGPIDDVEIPVNDVWGDGTTFPYLREGAKPAWRSYTPDHSDYQILTDAVKRYTDAFLTETWPSERERPTAESNAANHVPDENRVDKRFVHVTDGLGYSYFLHVYNWDERFSDVLRALHDELKAPSRNSTELFPELRKTGYQFDVIPFSNVDLRL